MTEKQLTAADLLKKLQPFAIVCSQLPPHARPINTASMGTYSPLRNYDICLIGHDEFTYLNQLPQPQRQAELCSSSVIIFCALNQHNDWPELGKCCLLSSQQTTTDLQNILSHLLHPERIKTENVHGTFVAVHHRGIIILGSPNSGKSELAYTLLERGHAFIADDAIVLKKYLHAPFWHGEPLNFAGFMHTRRLGFIDVALTFGSEQCLTDYVVHGIIKLSPHNENEMVLSPTDKTPTWQQQLPCLALHRQTSDIVDRVEHFARKIAESALNRPDKQDFYQLQRSAMGKAKNHE